MDRLRQIIDQKRQRVAAAKASLSLPELKLQASRHRTGSDAHKLLTALRNSDHINIIAEFKRRSPSKGVIRGGANPEAIAHEYESGGAAAVSVLTEEDFFAGSLDDLRSLRRATNLPILRKDFIFDQYQVYESAAAGADALLLIVAALDDGELLTLRRLTEEELEMDALVEVHTKEEMQRAIACGAKIIGVNNRNLTTFEVTLQTSIGLAALAPDDALLVSESGIDTVSDIERLRDRGYRGFLIGESLMRSDTPEALLREFTRAGKREAIRS